MTKKVVSYARAANKTGEGSIVAQIERGKAFAAERGWELLTSFTDIENNDALFKARPGIKSLCAYLDRERIDIVLCDWPLNVSDNRLHAARFLMELRAGGIELWSTAMAEHVTLRNLPYVERDSDQDQIVPAPSPATGRGIRPAGFGYRLSSAVDAAGRRIFGYRTIDPEHAQVIRRIFRMYAAGRSPSEIAVALNSEGVKGPGGRPWREEVIYENRAPGTGILNNTLYVGSRRDAKGEFNCDVPALRIISDELWERVKQQQANVTRRSSQSR